MPVFMKLECKSKIECLYKKKLKYNNNTEYKSTVGSWLSSLMWPGEMLRVIPCILVQLTPNLCTKYQ